MTDNSNPLAAALGLIFVFAFMYWAFVANPSGVITSECDKVNGEIVKSYWGCLLKTETSGITGEEVKYYERGDGAHLCVLENGDAYPFDFGGSSRGKVRRVRDGLCGG